MHDQKILTCLWTKRKIIERVFVVLIGVIFLKTIATITVKIKKNKTIENWFKEQSIKTSQLFNNCLELQMNLICAGEKIKSRFDLAQHFRTFDLGSDYKDKIYERVFTSIAKWLKSELLR